jgi:hypothetical protein
MSENQTPPTQRAFTEEVEIASKELVDRVKELIQEGNVRRLIIRDTDGKSLLEIPLTGGVVVGAALVAMSPVMAAIGALVALVARVRLEIVREIPDSAEVTKD